MNIAQAFKKSLITAVAVASMTLGMSNAVADQMFNFSFAGAMNTGSGTFTASDDVNLDGSFNLVGIDGTANGSEIVDFSWYAGADNTFFNPPSADTGHVNFGGISFLTLGGSQLNLFWMDGGYFITDSDLNPDGFSTGPGVERVELLIAVDEPGAVPAPGSIFLLFLGLVTLLVARRTQAQ